MILDKSQAIGIFDSGAGGLTVASAVKKTLPDENIVYFGDTAHLPYGDKSFETVKKYAIRITDFLLEKNCKLILIACNTASAAAYDIIKERVKDKALVLDVIEPATELVAHKETFKKVGIIGTKGTISADIYAKKIHRIKPDKEVVSLATPILVPLIEEGFIYDNISNAVIKEYLSNEKLNGIDALILACTHYPIIKNQIRKFYNFKTAVIDSSEVVALKLKQILSAHNLLNNQKTKAQYEFFVSDITDFFETLAEMFFDEKIHLQKKYL